MNYYVVQMEAKLWMHPMMFGKFLDPSSWVPSRCGSLPTSHKACALLYIMCHSAIVGGENVGFMNKPIDVHTLGFTDRPITVMNRWRLVERTVQ